MAPAAPTPTSRRATALPACLAVGFAVALGLLIASFPARNSDLWRHLANGRALGEGDLSRFGATGLTDAVAAVVTSVTGEGALVAVKAILVAGLAGLLVRLAHTTGPWWLATVCVALAVVALGNRVLLQPATVSYLFLGMTLWLLRPEAPAGPPRWADWRMLVLFAVWALADRGFIVGLGVVAAYRLGELFDGRKEALRRMVSLAAVAATGLFATLSVNASSLPDELTPVADAVKTPFESAYFTTFGDNPAAMAYFPLLALSLVSFLGVLGRGWRWRRFLPWAGLAVLTVWQVRTVPYFAVVAGPVMAWNVQDLLARRPVRGHLRPAGRVAFAGLLGLAGVGLLVAVWPGWMQSAPYEPRRWAVDRPVGTERAAAFVTRGRADGTIPADVRTLHVTTDTEYGFSWFAPTDDGFTDEGIAQLLVGDKGGKGADDRKASEALRTARVGLVVVRAGTRGRSAEMLARLLSEPEQWPLLHVSGGVAVFGWRDRQRAGADDLYRGREVDLDQLAFRPDVAEQAPATPPPADEREWWRPFVRPAVVQNADRDEALVLLVKAETEWQAAPSRHERDALAWRAAEVALMGAGGGGQPLWTDLPFRTLLALEALPPDPWDVSPAVLYAGVRAGRRAVAAGPDDAAAYAVLGQFYLRLSHRSGERDWSALPHLGRVRLAQASAALNRAVALNPSNAQAHLDLGLLYQELNCGDLSAAHLQKYRDLVKRAYSTLDPHAGEDRWKKLLDPQADDTRWKKLTDELARRKRVYEDESTQGTAGDRAVAADRLGLGETALALLLDSDPAALGKEGVKLELDLLLRTGRGPEVLAADPKLKDALGGNEYHSLRAMAYLAGGDYAAADGELAEMLKDQETRFGIIPEPYSVERATVISAQLVAEGLLTQRPGENSLEALVGRLFGEQKFSDGLGPLVDLIAHQNDVNALRGLMALEAGDIPVARRHFQAVTAFTTDRTAPGPLRAGHMVATTCLGWIERAERRGK